MWAWGPARHGGEEHTRELDRPDSVSSPTPYLLGVLGKLLHMFPALAFSIYKVEMVKIAPYVLEMGWRLMLLHANGSQQPPEPLC